MSTRITPAESSDVSRHMAPGPGSSRWLVPLLPAVIGFGVSLWGVASPSLWRDEAATMVVARMPLRHLFATLSSVDAVHTLYYLLIHFVIDVFGGSATAVRFPSVLGVAAAAAGTALLGRRLAGARTGLVAGLLVAASPTMSMYAEEARSYALVTAVAVWATYLLVRAIQEPGKNAYAGYGAMIALLGLLHLFAFLVLPAHAAVAWKAGSRRAWLITIAAAAVAISPFAIFATTQNSQLDWLVAPGPRDLLALVSSFAGSALLIIPIAALVAVALVKGPEDQPSNIDLRLLTTVWIIVPPAVLLIISLIHPYYIFRYVLLCVPAVALLAATGLTRLTARLGARALIPAGVVLLALSIPAHLAVRAETSRMDDLRRAATILEDNQRPGDVLVLHRGTYRHITAAYPAAYAHLKDLSRSQTPTKSDTLDGVEVTMAHFQARLNALPAGQRLWFQDNYVVPGRRGHNSPLTNLKARLIQHGSAFRLEGRWTFHGGTLYLYIKA